MRFRTLALALALAFGMTAMAEAAPRRPAIHRSARKGTVRKGNSKIAKGRRAQRGKIVRHR